MTQATEPRLNEQQAEMIRKAHEGLRDADPALAARASDAVGDLAWDLVGEAIGYPLHPEYRPVYVALLEQVADTSTGRYAEMADQLLDVLA